MGLIPHHEETVASLSAWWAVGGLAGTSFSMRYYWWRMTKGRKR
jgi:hypothetical protein